MTPPRRGPNTQKIALQTEDIRQMESEIPDPAITLSKKGISIPWKFAVLIFSIVIGSGGGLWGLQSLFGASASASELEIVSIENIAEHTDIKKSLVTQGEILDTNVKAVGSITTSVNKIEATQNRDIARKEARRLVEGITNRVKAEQTYDRLFDLNLNRLSRGADPCGTISCE